MSNETHEAARAQQITQAREELITQAQAAHCKFLAISEHARNTLLDQINAARELGILLLALKKSVRFGDFGRLFEDYDGPGKSEISFRFTARHGRNFMALGGAFPEPITDLVHGVQSVRDMMVIAGALPEPTHGTQASRGDFGPFVACQNFLQRGWAVLAKEREVKPVNEWPEDQRATIKRQLMPYIELYEQL